jgi:glycosyltransferase involved in cell wall biosynthesis
MLIIIKLKIKLKFDLLVVSSGSHSYFLSSFFLPINLIFVLHTIPEKREMKPLRLLLQRTINNKKKIVTVSNASKKMIEQNLLNGNYNENVMVIGNYYELENQLNISKKFDNKVTVLTLGHVIDYKNPKFFIDVAKKINNIDKNIEFIWAGEGPLLESCIKIVNKNKLKNVKFIGYVKDVESLYNMADIYMQCSLRESQSISILGAMSNSIACIGTNIGGIPEGIRQNENGYIFDISDVDSAVNYIEKLAGNKELRINMGKKSKELYDLYHCREVWINKMNKLYDSLKI